MATGGRAAVGSGSAAIWKVTFEKDGPPAGTGGIFFRSKDLSGSAWYMYSPCADTIPIEGAPGDTVR